MNKFRHCFTEVKPEEVSFKTEVLGITLDFPMMAPTNPDLSHFMLHREAVKSGCLGVIQADNWENLYMYQLDGKNNPVAVLGDKIEELEDVFRLYDRGVRIFFVETLVPSMATAHQVNAIKSKFPDSRVIAGCFMDSDSVSKFLRECSPDAIKVGIVGSDKDILNEISVLRDGVECIKDVYSVTATRGIPIWAELPINTSKEMALAIHAGADVIMSDQFFGAADETGKEEIQTMVERIVRYNHRWMNEVQMVTFKRGPIKEDIEMMKKDLAMIFHMAGCRNIKEFRERGMY